MLIIAGLIGGTSLLNFTKLSRFAANQNNFIGPVPPGITNHVTSLDLSFNKLSGPIPEDLLSSSQLLQTCSS
ncbi:hypothetical protein JHK82_045186 [Glycine max]|nr:hypothetical protein JHK82_045186 [Glycine max]KAG5108732.1 hypothetical protein JHK84_045639 [Glycine max]